MADRDPSTARLPSHVEVGALLRQVQAAGGFAMVLAKGEADSGALLVVLTDQGRRSRAWERMPSPDGHRVWTRVREEVAEDPGDFADWLKRRQHQDPDLWIVELDIPEGERFIR
ncbi:DUF1491 family protein [Novosphingobium piscinae]|uniref:DUF1491 family protein n=1 Tax=Novosphingobium piscinae TaxID=1507448 RepID=A0A7X1KQT6_9SPHN|nr:DUF1491 family protein [Novosphingobium piscinae]MBC2670047.1 DUF1491 family protein [Novosphingobium piscinae]